MKAKYLYLAMMTVALTAGFTSCSDDDDDITLPEATVIDRADITVDAPDTLQVEVGGTATFTITAGNEDYKVFSENTDIATATISGNVVTVTSSKRGIAGVVISDAKGARKRIMVKSMYLKMALDKESVTIGIKRGHTDGYAKVAVTAGNGSYKVKVADESVCKASVSDTTIVLTAVARGTTTVTVTDMMGLTATVSVTVDESTVPFTEDELAAIMSQTTPIISYENASSWDGGVTATVTDGKVNIHWSYYSWMSGDVDYTGDLTVGKKGKGTFNNKLDWDGGGLVEDLDIEIIKNDGSMVWGTMSKLTDDYLYTGYFIAEISK